MLALRPHHLAVLYQIRREPSSYWYNTPVDLLTILAPLLGVYHIVRTLAAQVGSPCPHFNRINTTLTALRGREFAREKDGSVKQSLFPCIVNLTEHLSSPAPVTKGPCSAVEAGCYEQLAKLVHPVPPRLILLGNNTACPTLGLYQGEITRGAAFMCLLDDTQTIRGYFQTCSGFTDPVLSSGGDVYYVGPGLIRHRFHVGVEVTPSPPERISLPSSGIQALLGYSSRRQAVIIRPLVGWTDLHWINEEGTIVECWSLPALVILERGKLLVHDDPQRRRIVYISAQLGYLPRPRGREVWLGVISILYWDGPVQYEIRLNGRYDPHAITFDAAGVLHYHNVAQGEMHSWG